MTTDIVQKNTKAKAVLRGAICGDIIGSCYEFYSTKNFNFELLNKYSRFTDDTVCSIAVADALLSNRPFDYMFQKWCRKYFRAGYGPAFRRWIVSDNPVPYNSWGNGSAMRVSPTGAVATSIGEAMEISAQSALVTHNHPEGVKGAQSVAVAIFMALDGATKDEIKDFIENQFGYDLSRDYEDIKAAYAFDVSCQGSVPEAIIAFLGSNDYESAVRRAVALGGDADTQGAITGSIAAAYYGYIPEYILDECLNRIPTEMSDVITEFDNLLEEKHGR